MAIRYILAQFNQAKNKIILSPSELRVRPGDAVIWISRLDEGETYVAGNFVGKTGLFTKDAYTMPGDGESELAELKADPSGSQAWTYTCSEGPLTTNADAADGDSGQGIIIVDPPPLPDDNDEKSPAQQEQEVEVA